jgi:hypothetical protein
MEGDHPGKYAPRIQTRAGACNFGGGGWREYAVKKAAPVFSPGACPWEWEGGKDHAGKYSKSPCIYS